MMVQRKLESLHSTLEFRKVLRRAEHLKKKKKPLICCVIVDQERMEIERLKVSTKTSCVRGNPSSIE